MGIRAGSLDGLVGRLTKLRSDCPAFMQATARALGEEYLASVRAASPVDEGELKESWVLRDTAGGVSVENHASHAFYVEHGHRSRGGGWIEGKHFQQSCEAALEESLSGALERRLEDFLKQVF